MKEAINRIKQALAVREVAPLLTYYAVQDGKIVAGDGRMTACAPCELEGRYLIPGEELNTLLARLPDDFTMKRDQGSIILRAGRMNGRIPTIEEETFHPVPEKSGWEPFRPALVEALAELRPFVSDNATHPWTLGIGITGEILTATNNIAVAQTSCAGVSGNAVIPVWVADFLLAQDTAPAEWYINDNHIAFRWKDGAWVRSQLLEGEFNQRAVDIVQSMEGPQWEIPMDWKAAYDYVAGLSQEVVVVEETRIRGGRGRAEINHETSKTPVPEGGSSTWNPKFLTSVIDKATHWDLDRWPKPAPWQGPRCRGIILGRAA